MVKDHNQGPPNDRFWTSLERVRCTVGASEWEFSRYLGMKPHEYLRARREKKELSSLAIFRLTDHIPISYENFMEGRIDFDAIHANTHGNTDYIPERYLVGARSRRRTTLTLLSYLDDLHGTREKDSVLKHFGVHAAAFKDPDALINVHFPADLCAYLKRRGYPWHAITAMGSYSTVVNKNGPVGQELSKEKSAAAVFERVFAGGVISRFDENWNYDLAYLTKSEAIVRITEREDAREALGTKNFGNVEACFMRAGVGAAFPSYIGEKQAPFKKLACIHQGDAACVLWWDFSACAAN